MGKNIAEKSSLIINQTGIKVHVNPGLAYLGIEQLGPDKLYPS